MSKDEGTALPAYARTLSHAIEEMHQQRWQFNRDRIRFGDVRATTHSAFEESILNVYDELRPYAHKRGAKELWEKENVDLIPRLCGKKSVARNIDANGGRVKVLSQNRVDHASPELLIKASQILDDVAHKLGFAPEGRMLVADPDEAVV